jgi:hypothetical protein
VRRTPLIIHLASVLTFTAFGPALLVAIAKLSLKAAGIGLIWLLIDRLIRLGVEFREYRQQAADGRFAVETLHETHYLVRREPKELIPDEMLKALPNRCEILSAVPREKENPPLGSLKAFINRGAFSLLILNSFETQISTIGKFFILHETGHISDVGYTMSIVTRRPFLVSAIFWLPCALLCAHIWQQIIFLLAYGLENFVTGGRYTVEMIADTFAISALTRSEGTASALRALALLRANLTRLNRVKPYNDQLEPESSSRIKGANLMTKALEMGREPIKAESMAAALIVPATVVRIIAFIVIAISPQIPADFWLKISVSILVLAAAHTLVLWTKYMEQTKAFIESVVFRSMTQDQWLNPDTRVLN